MAIKCIRHFDVSEIFEYEILACDDSAQQNIDLEEFSLINRQLKLSDMGN